MITPTISSLVLADSLILLKEWYDNGVREFINLNYNDPTYDSNSSYAIQLDPETKTTEIAYEDFWTNVKYFDVLDMFKPYDPDFHNFLTYYLSMLPKDSFKSYLTHMGILYWFAHKMLSPTGSFYHHCDPRTSHYIKIILDKIFGIRNFRNEIIWCYTSGGASKDYFARKHNIIFFYSKSNKYLFNTQKYKRYLLIQNGKEVGRDPRVEYFKDENGTYRVNLTLDWWSDIGIISPNSKTERVGLRTQKPEALLERIILASSNEGDLVVDYFNGSGTTPTVAKKLKRNFIGVDVNYRMIQQTINRLKQLNLEPKRDYYVVGIPSSSKELRILVNDNVYGTSKSSKFALQDITTKYYLKNVQSSNKKSGDHSIDGEFHFKYQGKDFKGIVQVTSTANLNHLKAFGSEIAKGAADIGVYVTFKDTVTKGMLVETKSYGKISGIDKFQILTFEELIDEGKQYQIPKDILTI